MSPALLAIVLATASVQDKAAWEEFKSVEGKYSMLLPAKPEQQRQNVVQDGFKTAVVSEVATHGDMVYLASHTDYREGKHDPEQIAADTLRAFLRPMKAKSLSEKKGPVAGVAGLICTFEAPEQGLIGEVRICFTGNRLFQVGALSPRDGYRKDDAKKSLDSFKLLGESKK